MAKDIGDIWRHCFQKWPAELHRRGVLVVSFAEQIAFDEFSAGEDMVIIERRSPDAMGGRLIMVAYQEIRGLKIVDVVKLKAFESQGFVPPPPPRK